MAVRQIALALLFASGACRKDAAEPAPRLAAEPEPPKVAEHTEPGAAVSPRDLRKITPERDEALKPCPAGEGDLLASAAAYYDARRYENALACAAQAAAAMPRSPDAHSERGAALSALGRLEEARVAYARALVLEPDHADALLGAADLYVTRIPPSRDVNELGFEYARRGRLAAKKQKDGALLGQFALLEAMALNSLGRNKEALERAEEALAHGPDEDGEALYEKACALYEQCRFDEAKREFQKLLRFGPPKKGYAHQHLGLIYEREGKDDLSQVELAAARDLLPEEFPPEMDITPQDFGRRVAAAVKGLKDDLRKDLDGIPVTTEELPALDDLVASDPPLSPAILGLFRGPSKGEPCPAPEEEPGPCRLVVLYRKNLLRVAQDEQELAHQIHITLVHEVGHLRGEDDVQLAARGLE